MTFSVDWALVRGNAFQKNSSGTIKLATSVILDETASLIASEIASEYGVLVPNEDIEEAFQKGDKSIFVGHSEVEFMPYVDRASKKISMDAIKPLQQALRTEGGGVNIILMAGGGSPFYLNSMKESFPNAEVLMAESTVMANARGFHNYAMVNTE